jgi:hypothetical protein
VQWAVRGVHECSGECVACVSHGVHASLVVPHERHTLQRLLKEASAPRDMGVRAVNVAQHVGAVRFAAREGLSEATNEGGLA